MSTLEAIFKANNARVKVDFKGGPEMINLIERGLDDLFETCRRTPSRRDARFWMGVI